MKLKNRDIYLHEFLLKQVNQVDQELTVNQAHKDPKDQLDQTENPAKMEHQAKMVKTETMEREVFDYLKIN